MDKTKVYDILIVGAGASGLFCAAVNENKVDGLILEKTKAVGKKLLMSGAGQCNITHAGNIKEFLSHYGSNGKMVRTVLYKYNNISVIDFFEKNGVKLFEREDGKVFPKSLKSSQIVDVLKLCAERNGFHVEYSCDVSRIEYDGQLYTLFCNEATDKGTNIKVYRSRKVVISTGGCSYPTSGSDGSMFNTLINMGLEVIPPRPALVPVFVQNYPYTELSGISFSKVKVTIQMVEKTTGQETISLQKKLAENVDDLLLTHTNFSGPAILNISRAIYTGNTISINYFPEKRPEEFLSEIKKMISGNSKQAVTFLTEYLNTIDRCSQVPKRFVEVICHRAELAEGLKASALTGDKIKRIVALLTNDRFSVSGTGGFNVAMVTTGGVALEEVEMKTMQCKKYPGLYMIGEVLDVDGDTGGYNLQWAFSSGHAASITY